MYDLDDVLVFKSVETDEEVRFVQNFNQNDNVINRLNHPCLQTQHDILVSMNTENIFQEFATKNGDIYLLLSARVSYTTDYDKILGSPFQDILFYDYVTQYMFLENTSTYLNFIAADKGNNLTNALVGSNSKLQNYTINGVEYKNIYVVQSNLVETYFSKEKRIIGYKDANSEIWLFDRIE